MARRAIPIIAFSQVPTIYNYNYIHVYVCVTCVSMCCIRSQGSCVIPGGWIN